MFIHGYCGNGDSILSPYPLQTFDQQHLTSAKPSYFYKYRKGIDTLISLMINYFLSKIILNVLAWWQFGRGIHVIAISDFLSYEMLIL